MNQELKLGLGANRYLLVVLGLMTGAFLILPLLVLIPSSWNDTPIVQFPPHGFSLQWYSAVFQGNTWTSPFFVSLRLALIGGLIATVLGTSAALGMRRLTAGRSTRLTQSLFIAPLALPYVAYALGLYQLITKISQNLDNSLWPLTLGEAVLALPLVYIVVASSLANVDPRLNTAAETLGARWPTVIWRVELPLIRLAVLGAFVFAFANIFDEATLAIFLGPVSELTLAQQLYRSAAEAIQPTLSAVSTLITLLAILVLGSGSLISARGSRAVKGGHA